MDPKKAVMSQCQSFIDRAMAEDCVATYNERPGSTAAEERAREKRGAKRTKK